MPQTVSTTSWFKRILNSLIGMVIGVGLIIGAFVLIFWNEGHSLHIAQSLAQAQQVLIEVAPAPVVPANNLKVIHFTGQATTKDNLTDETLGLSVNAIKLTRTVEMYQWQEDVETHTEKELGGSEKEIKTYSYRHVWAAHVIDSQHFNEPTGHTNPTQMPLVSKAHFAKTVTAGDFTLPASLIEKMRGDTLITLTDENLEKLHTYLNKPVKQLEDEVYVGSDAAHPSIGDLRIQVSDILTQPVSIIAQQTQNTLQPYLAPSGKYVNLLSMGNVSAQQMFDEAKDQNRLLAWVLRGVSLLMLFMGIALVLAPIAVLADIMPFLGSLVGISTGFIAFVLALCLWAVGTAIAWFTVRPLFSVGLVLAIALICYVIMRVRSYHVAGKTH